MNYTPKILPEPEIKKVLDLFPDLSANGFSHHESGASIPATKAELDTWRDYLLYGDGISQVKSACYNIEEHSIAIRGNSYGMKHKAEGWARSNGRFGYVSNGAFIVAAILFGYGVIREKNSPNCGFKDGPPVDPFMATGWEWKA